MHINNIKTPKRNYLLNNINDYFIQIDYFDKTGIKKYNNNIPLKYMFSQKPIGKIKSN
ncbi:hypothetical protein OAR00_00210 [Alphaproteobacteria bacterium]|nr:hypothetical protein [Alphaproteobacteria bacterium]MDC1022956.1 hypothetical protein [Alphaproteobacteria bacterium]